MFKKLTVLATGDGAPYASDPAAIDIITSFIIIKPKQDIYYF